MEEKVREEVAKEPMIGQYSEAALLERAQQIVEERTADWETKSKQIPHFDLTEIETGAELGKGGFFVVKEVTSIFLQDATEQALPNTAAMEDEDYIQGVVQDREFMSHHTMRGKDCRYCIKAMLPDCHSDPSKFVNTIVDIAIEAKFLSVIRHPNIIKMRATSKGNICAPNSFLILDRLYDTLDKRLVQWGKRDQQWNLFDFQKKKEKAFLAERLTVAFDVASAIEYLHDRSIIYRDLKPDNVGFDVRGDAKLFDFGLATEFDSSKTMGSYKLTGDTGTMRYMAPEVALNKAYTEKADVYSFGIILWQVLALEIPYGPLPDDGIYRKVVHCGGRPKIEGKWPTELRRLLQDCFASGPRRPPMTRACEIIRKAIHEVGGETLVDDDILDSARSARSLRHHDPKM
ncbi:unnamed protein product [Cylindrotheca closterium]|uniref:Protein kinase domain-containing protein n=1 Tax=Cylindrotheca closterium TaxID=2856 RepID=A0AAD2GEG4_9STRA|nr:unnamed protein product [Cylindrotheca closterium]